MSTSPLSTSDVLSWLSIEQKASKTNSSGKRRVQSQSRLHFPNEGATLVDAVTPPQRRRAQPNSVHNMHADEKRRYESTPAWRGVLSYLPCAEICLFGGFPPHGFITKRCPDVGIAPGNEAKEQ